MINKCRVCNNKLAYEPLITYKNMPCCAQFLPDKKSLKKDRGIKLEIYQCKGCGLVQLSNNPVAYYREVIRAAAFSKEMKEFRVRQFNAFVKKYSLKRKKAIEIGCGRGEYLRLMKQTGANVFGLEWSEESVSQCIKKSLKVFQGFVDNGNYQIKESPFDAFFILNFLEHLPDPNSTLRGIYNNLTEEGIGLIEVPNFDMMLQKKLFSEFTRDHLFYFTKETLKELLTLNGFDVLENKIIWHDYIISATVKKRKKLDLSMFNKHQKIVKNDIKKYLARFQPKNVAIWGAGHQALAMISLINAADKIKYVIDSAPFKQNKYTPASHIPIVAPASLNSDPVSAIIIMAAGYSDEVVKIIRQKYRKRITIAVLRDYGLELIK